jgi:hypothetical protein
MNMIQRRWLAGRRGVLGLLLVAGTASAGCDFLDPTDVENPRTTTEDLASAENPTRSLLPGLRAQMARLVDAATVLTEVVSDNFSIHGTGLTKGYDTPSDITPSVVNSTSTATGLYWNAQELRALATFVLDEIAPNDETAGAADIAEAHYYRAMAYIYLGENFSAAPTTADGAPETADQLIDHAISDLGQAASFGTATDAALARAYRWKGDQANASAAANAVLNADPDFVFLQGYDATSISNTPHSYLVLRALQEMQPLPRLDFLDPKYLDRTQGIAIAKAEEMHLILAEIALVNSQLATAGTALHDAIALAQSRSTTTFDDEDPRLNADLSIRPRDASILVRADATSDYRAGLVLTRPGTVTQPIVSGSSLDPDSVQSLSTEAELWHAFHLARQEILFLEGRRLADLGIKLPIMQREIDANPNIDPDDPGTTVVLPAYIPAGDGMDLYTPASPYDDDEVLTTTEVTINFDMNLILATNMVSPFN